MPLILGIRRLGREAAEWSGARHGRARTLEGQLCGAELRQLHAGSRGGVHRLAASASSGQRMDLVAVDIPIATVEITTRRRADVTFRENLEPNGVRHTRHQQRDRAGWVQPYRGNSMRGLSAGHQKDSVER